MPRESAVEHEFKPGQWVRIITPFDSLVSKTHNGLMAKVFEVMAYGIVLEVYHKDGPRHETSTVAFAKEYLRYCHG